MVIIVLPCFVKVAFDCASERAMHTRMRVTLFDSFGCWKVLYVFSCVMTSYYMTFIICWVIFGCTKQGCIHWVYRYYDNVCTDFGSEKKIFYLPPANHQCRPVSVLKFLTVTLCHDSDPTNGWRDDGRASAIAEVHCVVSVTVDN